MTRLTYEAALRQAGIRYHNHTLTTCTTIMETAAKKLTENDSLPTVPQLRTLMSIFLTMLAST